MMFDLGCLISDVKNNLRSRCALHRSTIKHQTSNLRSGISLIEILVSIFVLLFGLMGVAAIFPVGNHYVIEAKGQHVRTWLNGVLSVDLEDAQGARSGRIAFQVHSGGPTEVRFRALELTLLE